MAEFGRFYTALCIVHIVCLCETPKATRTIRNGLYFKQASVQKSFNNFLLVCVHRHAFNTFRCLKVNQLVVVWAQYNYLIIVYYCKLHWLSIPVLRVLLVFYREPLIEDRFTPGIKVNVVRRSVEQKSTSMLLHKNQCLEILVYVKNEQHRHLNIEQTDVMFQK